MAVEVSCTVFEDLGASSVDGSAVESGGDCIWVECSHAVVTMVDFVKGEVCSVHGISS